MLKVLPLLKRSQKVVMVATITTLVIFALAGVSITHIDGYTITSTLLHDSPSNPLNKVVEKTAGLWMSNYRHYPVLVLIPSLAFMTDILTIMLSKKQYLKSAFVSSWLTLASVILNTGVSMFPFLIPASVNTKLPDRLGCQFQPYYVDDYVLDDADLIYTSWVFRVLSGKITLAHIQNNDHTAY